MGIYADYGQDADEQIATLLDRTNVLTGQISSVQRELAAAVAGRDQLLADLAAMTAQRDDLQRRLDELTEPLPPPPPDPEPTGWTANGLPPAGKTLLGAASGNLASLEGRVGTLGVFRSYYQANQQAGMVQRAKADHAAGRIPWISTKLPYGWAQMASGAGDSWANALASQLGGLGKPVWVALHHEPEGDGVAADWVRLQQRVAPIFKAHPTIAYTIILMGWGQWQAGNQPMASWWPGKQYVDVLGFDPYNWYDTTNSSGKKSLTWTELKTGYYDKIAAWLKSTGNDDVRWGVAETGYTNTAAALPQGGVCVRGTGADWIVRAYDDMKTLGGSVLTYFDVSAAVNNEPSDWTWPVTTEPKAAAFRRALMRSDRWPG